MAMPHPGKKLPVVSNEKSSSWKEIWTKSSHCPEESIAEKEGEDDGEGGDDVGGQEDHRLAQD